MLRLSVTKNQDRNKTIVIRDILTMSQSMFSTSQMNVMLRSEEEEREKKS